MTDQIPVPEAVQRILQKSIAVVSAFRHLRRAGEEKASPETRAKYRKQLQNALVELDQAVSAWKPERSSGPGMDWAGLFKTALRGMDFVRDLKGGKIGARQAAQWVEAEVTDMKTPRR